jgi:hypothetical protein
LYLPWATPVFGLVAGVMSIIGDARRHDGLNDWRIQTRHSFRRQLRPILAENGLWRESRHSRSGAKSHVE